MPRAPKPVEHKLGVTIDRRGRTRLYPFTRYFKGFERNPTLVALWGPDTARALRRQKVEFFSARWGYMGTSDVDGHILISVNHLRNSDFRTVYLDLVHELCHVRQFQLGKPLFYPKLSYVDAPSEIDAYRRTVLEGRRIGMTEKELFDYLHTEWITPVEHRRLARHCKLDKRFWSTPKKRRKKG